MGHSTLPGLAHTIEFDRSTQDFSRSTGINAGLPKCTSTKTCGSFRGYLRVFNFLQAKSTWTCNTIKWRMERKHMWFRQAFCNIVLSLSSLAHPCLIVAVRGHGACWRSALYFHCPVLTFTYIHTYNPMNTLLRFHNILDSIRYVGAEKCGTKSQVPFGPSVKNGLFLFFNVPVHNVPVRLCALKEQCTLPPITFHLSTQHLHQLRPGGETGLLPRCDIHN